MVSAPAANDAVARARRTPSLRVGLHLVLTEGRPVLPGSAVKHLVDKSGLFRTDMAALGAAIAFSRQVRRELAAEITAQFDRVSRHGPAARSLQRAQAFPFASGDRAIDDRDRRPFRPASGSRTPRTCIGAAQDRTADPTDARSAHGALGDAAAPALSGRRPARARSRLRAAVVRPGHPGPPARPDAQSAGRPQRNLPSSRHRPLRRGRTRLSRIARNSKR